MWVFPTEEKDGQEVSRGQQVPSFEENNPKQGKPWCI
jgi:hypothetical protein